MRKHPLLRLLLALWFSVLLAACRGSSPAPHPDTADNTGQPPAIAGMAGAPRLETLADTERQLSIVGPGFTAIPPQETVMQGNAALGPGAALTLNAAGSMAYAVYGIAGFDGDNGPTSARITMSSVTGQYFIGFSDYVAGTWRFAGPFNGSATAEIPLPSGGGSSDYLSPSAFTSPKGTCYFMVGVPTGSLAVITGAELGVHGGGQGPDWTSFEGIDGGATGCLVHWRPSASCIDPDFAGYYLERAPLLAGSFTRLEAQPITSLYYLDTTAELGVNYRYRIAAVDASGNQSMWAGTTGGPVSGGLVDPVPVLKLPRGPLQSPAQVTLDLSASYDPEGVGITSFTFGFIMFPPTISGASPTATVTLPPGCHMISGQVTTGDGRIASTTAFLKVYPTWQSTPSVVAVRDPSAMLPRLSGVRAALQPGTSRPVMFGAENATRSCTAYYQHGSGSMRSLRIPLLDPVANSGEPAIVGQTVAFPVCTGDNFQIALYEAGTLRWFIPGIPDEGFSSIAAVPSNSGQLYAFVAQDNGGQIDLTAFNVNTRPLAETLLIPNIVTLIAIDAAFNTASNCFDIVYSTAASTEWIRWDPAANLVTDNATIAAFPSSTLDIEQHPLTGRPGLARFDSLTVRWVYTELDAAMTWIPGEIIDNSAANGNDGDLEYGAAGAAYMYFATAPGQSNLHQRSGPGAWAPRNTPAFAVTGGQEVALMNLQGSEDFICVDRTSDNSVVIGELEPAPAETVIWELQPFQGLLNNIQGAAGTADTTPTGAEVLHVLFNDSFSWTGQHYTSSNGGATWTPQAANTLRDFDLGATRDGGVYATNNVVLNHELHFWDETVNAFALYTTAPGNVSYSFLSCGMFNQNVRWVTFDEVNTMTYTTGRFGVAPTTSTATADVIPVWTGAGDMAGYSAIHCLLGHGANLNEASVLWDPGFDGAMNAVSDSLAAEILEVYDMPAIRMKQLAACSYLNTHSALGLSVPSMAIWTAYGPFLDAQRFNVDLLNGNTTTQLPMYFDINLDEPRRSCTAAAAAGLTAVGLVSPLDGSEPYFEWSNYGTWEQLEVPPAMSAACNPELIVGRDGAWHMIYWDWATDRVLCLSTL